MGIFNAGIAIPPSTSLEEIETAMEVGGEATVSAVYEEDVAVGT